MWKKEARIGIAALAVLLVASIGILVGCKPAEEAPPAAEKALTEYNIAVYLDYTGPYAEIAPDCEAATKTAFTWWNKAKGADLGIKLTPKYYDFRYDGAVTASQHPAVISDIAPIAILEDGIPYVLALVQQLPLDKVPAIHMTGGYNFFNAPHAWIFCPLTSYGEHFLAFLDWWDSNIGTPKFAAKGFDTPPWHTVRGILEAYCEEKGYDYRGTKFTSNMEPDMTPSVLWALDKDIDFLVEVESPYNTIVFAEAMHEVGAYGEFDPVYSLHEGLAEVGRVVGYDKINGYYMVTPVDFLSTTGRGQKLWYDNIEEIEPGLGLEATTCRAFTASLILTQAVEKAAATVGPENLTGQALYDELDDGTFDGMDLSAEIVTDPYDRLIGAKGVKVYEMVEGEIVDVTGDIGWQPVPYYSTKWLYEDRGY